MRSILTPELSGLVVVLVGVQLAIVGLQNLFGAGGAAAVKVPDLELAGLTLSVIVALNVWTSGRIRLFCVLIGVIISYGAGLALGLIKSVPIADLNALPLIHLPRLMKMLPSFQIDMLLPFALAGLGGAIATSANITVAQRLNDQDWVRPDLASIRRGTFAEGILVTVGGALGACGIGTISTNIGVMLATGVVARRVAYYFGGFAICVAFLPRVAGIMLLIPHPIISGTLLFTSSFTIMSGFQIILARMMDSRKTLVVGMSLAATLAVYGHPGLGSHLPEALRPLASSALVAGMIVGLGMTLIFRIGIHRQMQTIILPGPDFPEQIETFMLRDGARWGVRPDVINRATRALNQLFATILAHGEPNGPIALAARFDEHNLECQIRYVGAALTLSDQRGGGEDAADEWDGTTAHAGLLIRRAVDRIASRVVGGVCRIDLHFEH